MPLKQPSVPKTLKDFPVSPKETRKRVRKPGPVGLPPVVPLRPKAAAEKSLPYEGRLFSLSTREAGLGEILFGLAKEADLNLVIDHDVNAKKPVSVEFKNLSLRRALDNILSVSDYFYTLEGNVLRIRAFGTEFFHFNYPLFINNPESSVGGDMLGNVGGQKGQGGTDLSGEFTIETKLSDEKYQDIWEQIEKALAPAGKKGAKEGGLLSENGRALVNRMAGTIVVTDRRKNLKIVERFLGELETSLRRQVIIEAKIMEVALNHEHQYGINWSFIKKGISGGFAGQFDIGSNLRAGTEIFTLHVRHEGTKKTFDALLDALSVQGNVNVLSSPRLNVLNNQSALISVGRTLPFVDFDLQTTTDQNGNIIYTSVPTIQRAQAGVTLGITPQISGDGTTTLHIIPVITDKTGEESFSFQQATFTIPVIDIRETDTTIRVADGDTVVIGGLIQDRATDTVTKIPLLGDIPLIGKLFSNQKRSNRKSELVIMLTSTIVEK